MGREPAHLLAITDLAHTMVTHAMARASFVLCRCHSGARVGRSNAEADALREGTGRDTAVLWTPLSSWFPVRRGDLLCWILNGEGCAPVALPQHQAESIDSRCTHHELEPSRIHDVLLPSRYMQAVLCACAFKRASVPRKASCRLNMLRMVRFLVCSRIMRFA